MTRLEQARPARGSPDRRRPDPSDSTVRPRADAADPFGSNAQDHSWRMVCAGREGDIWSEVNMSESLQQRRGAALRDPARAAHDQILAEPHRIDNPGVEG